MSDFSMTDLEERLKEEGGEKLKERLISRLSKKASQLKELRDSGLSPEEYQKVETVWGGLTAALDTIVKAPVKAAL